MVASYTKVGQGVQGIFKVRYYAWNCAGVTTVTIVHPIKAVKYAKLVGKTGLTAGQSLDVTTTAGNAVIAGVTSNNIGYLKIVGK